MSKRGLNRKQKNYLIGGLLAVVLVMAVGYAAFSTSLNINNTAKIDSKWDVRITNISADKTATCTDRSDASTCSTTGDIESSYDNSNGLTATFSAALISPGDSVTYTIEVSNAGTLDAVINSLTLNKGNNPAIDVTTVPESLSDNNAIQLPKKTGNENGKATIDVIVTYKSDVEGQPAVTNTSITVTLGAVQDDGSSYQYYSSGMSISELVQYALANNHGLSADTTGRYIYKGESPQNYITFSGQTWRIVSIESDGTMKIVKQDSIGNMAWDAVNTRNSSTSSYCTNTSNYGCNAWTKTYTPAGNFTLYYPNGNPTTDSTTYSGSVAADASLNTFFNGDYYENTGNNANYLGSDKQYIVAHNFNIGTPGTTSDTESIATDAQQEASYVWNGKVGLIQATDYMKASTDSACTSLSAAYNSPYPCGNGNYLNTGITYWTISPSVNFFRSTVWFVYSSGGMSDGIVSTGSYDVRPAVYLSSSIKLDGDGSVGNEYHIVS